MKGTRASKVVKVSAAARTGTSFTLKLAAASTRIRNRLTRRLFKEISFRGVTALNRPLRLAAKIAFSACLALHAAEASRTLSDRNLPLYPGITAEQSAQAHAALKAFYNGNTLESERTLARLALLEGDTLPPLSRLLQVGTAVMQLQRNDASGKEEEARLRKLIDNASKKGLALCDKAGESDPAYPTYLLIQGGIQGFLATLIISANPPKALNEGLHALNFLEKALKADSTIQDAYMGEGIFQCSAARAPLMVRATLKMLGRETNLYDGLNALRRSAYEGQYTSVASQLFLIQFFSPYDNELRQEKRQIFHTLMKTFPQSPYYLFLREEESLCFYPDSFYQVRTRRLLERKIRSADPHDFAGIRYLNLIKEQYTLLNPNPAAAYAPDTSLDLREYAYYPVFIRALRLRRELMNDTAAIPSRARARLLKALRDSTLTQLRDSDMNSANRRLYEWHIRDALKPKMWMTHPMETDTADEDSTGG